jgi:hypothetical protein
MQISDVELQIGKASRGKSDDGNSKEKQNYCSTNNFHLRKIINHQIIFNRQGGRKKLLRNSC